MKRGTPDHPKVKHLAQLLNINEAWAVGILELLWHFTSRYAPQGDNGKYSDEVIARAVKWHRPSGRTAVQPQWKLSDALVKAQWLDSDPIHRLVVHDWSDHSDQSVARYLARHKLAFVQSETSLPLPLPEPLPKPAAEQFDLLPSKKPRKENVEPLFDEFWDSYWRKEGKVGAKRAFLKLSKTEKQAKEIIQAVRDQTAFQISKEPKFRPMASTWLNDGRYEDKPNSDPPRRDERDNAPPLFVDPSNGLTWASEQIYRETMERRQREKIQ